MGVACVAGGSPVDDILDAADTALYLAKSEGRNRVVYDKLLNSEFEQGTGYFQFACCLKTWPEVFYIISITSVDHINNSEF